MAEVSKSPAVAKADDSHDGRYTHQSHVSPGGPGGPTTEPTEYPKWVTPKDGKAVIVQNPDEEAAVLGVTSAKGFARLGAMLTMLAIALCLIAAPEAVTILSTTTLSAAVAIPAQGNQANQVRLASVANVTATSFLWVDAELMQVTAAPVSGQPTFVVRGVGGTMPGAHASAATVTIGPGDAFHSTEPPAGSCTASAQVYSPWITAPTGNVWVCRGATNTWNGTNIRALTYNSTQNGLQ